MQKEVEGREGDEEEKGYRRKRERKDLKNVLGEEDKGGRCRRGLKKFKEKSRRDAEESREEAEKYGE